MTALVELFPDTQARRWEAIERACEAIEKQTGTFTVRDIFKATSNYGAATQSIRVFLGHGLIERVSKHGASPVHYRVKPEATKESTR